MMGSRGSHDEEDDNEVFFWRGLDLEASWKFYGCEIQIQEKSHLEIEDGWNFKANKIQEGRGIRAWSSDSSEEDDHDDPLNSSETSKELGREIDEDDFMLCCHRRRLGARASKKPIVSTWIIFPWPSRRSPRIIYICTWKKIYMRNS